jgi:hypothetical protein
MPRVAAGQAGPARKLGRWLALWWSQAADGRTYQRRRAVALMPAAAGLGVLVVCGVLVTSTVKMLVLGSGIGFADRGRHRLKGVPDQWQLFAVEHT